LTTVHIGTHDNVPTLLVLFTWKLLQWNLLWNIREH